MLYEVITQYWSHMRKLVSSRSTDMLIDGIWYNDEGDEIGFESMYWPELIVIQVVNEGDIPRITSYNVCYTKLLRYAER